MTTADLIAETCDEVKALLLAKNKAYGDSALNPVRIFSKADNLEQIRVRLDDKLSRIARGSDAGEDVILDLIGYLTLFRCEQKIIQEKTASLHSFARFFTWLKSVSKEMF